MKKTVRKSHHMYTARVAIAVLLGLAVLSLTGCGKSKDQNSGEETKSVAAAESAEITESAETAKSEVASSADTEARAAGGIHHAEIVVKNYGTIKVELDGDTAPITVDNFIGLAKSGFYNGLTFHRIIDGFMIQGGDPKGNGTGGSDKKIKGEFSENGVDNPISHKAGVISMARAQDPDSASSQFFITVADSTFLDGQYAAFGHVTAGMDVAEKIAKDAKPTDSNGTIPADAQPVMETVRILD